MLRLLAALAVSFVVVGCGPAGSVDQLSNAGRCTADAQCPVGTSCDAKLGVCAAGTSSTAKPLASNYGKYCERDSHCADIPGTTCNSYQCTNSCANGAQCPSGTTCGGPSYPGCFQNCSSSSECKNDSMCGVMKPSSGPEFSACFPKWPSDTGGTCKDNLGCDDSNICLKSVHPNGYCSKVCVTASDCSLGDLCVRMKASDADGLCVPKCTSPGSQSTCVPGTSCKALSSVSYGFCF